MCSSLNNIQVHAGDRVKFVRTEFGHKYDQEHLGQVGTAREDCGPFVVVVFDNGSWIVCYPEELEVLHEDTDAAPASPDELLVEGTE